jgi:hypothetical protein
MAKKVATKTPAKSIKSEAAKPAGLTKRQVAVLTALKGGKEVTRKQLAEKTEIDKGWSKLLGASTQDKVSPDSMEGLGYVKSAQHEGSAQLVYTITSKGTKALADHATT